MERQRQPDGRWQQQRLSEVRQRQLIAEQRSRFSRYGQHLDRQQQFAQQRMFMLQQQRRMAQYRFQQQYWERLRQQQRYLQSVRSYDYDRDPYFYTAPNYRYSRGGRFYETNEYGANLLRQAINYGYEEGFRAGQADREDNWQYNYQESFAYQDGNYGYDGNYVDQDEYNYYFRQGFEKGYEDGYYSRNRYGTYSNGKYAILGAILSQILNFQSLSDY